MIEAYQHFEVKMVAVVGAAAMAHFMMAGLGEEQEAISALPRKIFSHG